MVKEVLVFGSKRNGRKSFQCSVEMCDKDIVRDLQIFLVEMCKTKVRKSHWTQTWKWKLSGGKRAFECVEKNDRIYVSTKTGEIRKCG